MHHACQIVFDLFFCVFQSCIWTCWNDFDISWANIPACSQLSIAATCVPLRFTIHRWKLILDRSHTLQLRTLSMCNCRSSTCGSFSFLGDLLSLKTLSLAIMELTWWFMKLNEKPIHWFHIMVLDLDLEMRMTLILPWANIPAYSQLSIASYMSTIEVFHPQVKADSWSVILCSCERFRCATALPALHVYHWGSQSTDESWFLIGHTLQLRTLSMCNCRSSTCGSFSFVGDFLSLKTLSLAIMEFTWWFMKLQWETNTLVSCRMVFYLDLEMRMTLIYLEQIFLRIRNCRLPATCVPLRFSIHRWKLILDRSYSAVANAFDV